MPVLVSQSYATIDIMVAHWRSRFAAPGKRTSTMSILTHDLDRPLAERPVRISDARKAQLERIALQALGLLSMGSVLTALIALRTAIHIWHLPA